MQFAEASAAAREGKIGGLLRQRGFELEVAPGERQR